MFVSCLSIFFFNGLHFNVHDYYNITCISVKYVTSLFFHVTRTKTIIIVCIPRCLAVFVLINYFFRLFFFFFFAYYLNTKEPNSNCFKETIFFRLIQKYLNIYFCVIYLPCFSTWSKYFLSTSINLHLKFIEL